MKKLYFLIVLLLITIAGNAQEIRKTMIVLESNIIATTSFSFDRIIPLTDRSSLTIGGDYIMGTGFGTGSHWLAPEVNLLSFGPRNYLESGMLYVLNISKNSETMENSPGLRLAYRHQGNKGLVLRVTFNYVFSIDPPFLPALGIG